MALNKEPILKRCRYLGISPMVMGISKESNRNPGANNRKKVSEYGMQLKEKQKLKFIYGVLERPPPLFRDRRKNGRQDGRQPRYHS